LAAIPYFHRAANEASPTAEESVKAVLGIRRTVGGAPVRKKAATSDIVIAMAAEGKSLRALRNRAVLLLGFAGAFRRTELVALNVEDLEQSPEGLLNTFGGARPTRRASAARLRSHAAMSLALLRQ
jgi:site-specific recombinase XerC